MDGLNPEVEMMRFLTASGYANTPKLLGEVAMVRDGRFRHSMIVAQEFVQNQGDAWRYTQNYLARFIETMGLANKDITTRRDRCQATAASPARSASASANCTPCSPHPIDDPDFAPEPGQARSRNAWGEAATTQLARAFEALRKIKTFSNPKVAQDAALHSG